MVVGVEWRESRWAIGDSLDELAQLGETAGVEVVGRFVQRLATPNPATYVGKGKLEEIRQAKAELNYNVALFDEELAPGQQRHLEDALGVKVIDRTGLILDIFARRAQTHEGRLQVELAQLEYRLPRLDANSPKGKTTTWKPMQPSPRRTMTVPLGASTAVIPAANRASAAGSRVSKSGRLPRNSRIGITCLGMGLCASRGMLVFALDYRQPSPRQI